MSTKRTVKQTHKSKEKETVFRFGIGSAKMEKNSAGEKKKNDSTMAAIQKLFKIEKN